MPNIKKRLGLLVAVFGLLIMGSQQASATVLLNLIDPPAQTNTAFSFSFNASATTTTVSLAGYQLPSFSSSTFNSFTLGGSGPNLLGAVWTLVPAASGSDTFTQNDGTSVPALFFGGVTVGSYDTYSQTISTIVGRSYTLSFLFTNPASNAPSGFLVTTSATPSAVPEPSSLALTGIAGLMGLGYARSRRRRASRA